MGWVICFSLYLAVRFILQLMGLFVCLISYGVMGVKYKWSNVKPVTKLCWGHNKNSGIFSEVTLSLLAKG